jgi:hypothetical protein
MISRSSSVEARESTFSGSSEGFAAFGRRVLLISRSRSSRDFFSRRRDPRSRIHSSRAVVAITLCTHASTLSLTSLLSSRIEGVRGAHAGGCRLVPVLTAFRGSLPFPAWSPGVVQGRNDQAVASYRPHTFCRKRTGDSAWRMSSRDRCSNKKSDVIPAGTPSMPYTGPRPCRLGEAS